MKDKLWFFGAYNHFNINKVISGVRARSPPTSASSTTRRRRKPGRFRSKDTVVGYIQFGRSRSRIAVSRRARPPNRHSLKTRISWVYKGEHQRVWSNRLFTRSQVQSVRLRLPARHQGRSGHEAADVQHRPELHQRRGVGRVRPRAPEAAGHGPVDLLRARQARQPRSEIRFRVRPRHQQVHDRRPHPAPTQYRPPTACTDQIQFVDVGMQWRSRQQLVRAATTVTRGMPATYRIGGTSTTGRRSPRVCAGITSGRTISQASATRSSRTSAGIGFQSGDSFVSQPGGTADVRGAAFPEGNIFTRNSFAPRLGISYDLTGKGSTVLKGFYGRYYYNYADAFSSLNPAGANYKTFKFNDLDNNSSTTARRNSAVPGSAGGTTTTVDPDMKKPYADEFDASVEHQFWGESSFRVAYVRKNTAQRVSRRVDLARVGNFTVPTQVTVQVRDFVNGVAAAQTLNLMDLLAPARRAATRSPTFRTASSSTTRCSSRSTSDSARVCSCRPATTTSGATNCGAAARLELHLHSNTMANPSTSPLNTDVLTIGFFNNAFPTVTNRQNSTNWQGRADRPLLVQVRHRRGGQLPRPERLRLLARLDRNAARAGTFRVFSENIENNRTDTAAHPRLPGGQGVPVRPPLPLTAWPICSTR